MGISRMYGVSIQMVSKNGIAASILKGPNHKLRRKGAIILSGVDEIVREFSELPSHFYIVERRGWAGINESEFADIKLVEDLATLKTTSRRFPNAILLEVGPADFVNTDVFFPLNSPKHYYGIQIARWDKFKRHKLFVRAAGLLPDQRFLKFGHFACGGDSDEIALKREVCELIQHSASNVKLLYSKADCNIPLSRKGHVINRIINTAKVGVITSRIEGINRFKMECLAANLPVLVATDTCGPLRKHINRSTGDFFDPTPEGLARALERIRHNTFLSPRKYLLQHTGINASLCRLRVALNRLAVRDGHTSYFKNLTWDGRNESMTWGEEALKSIKYSMLERS